MSFIKRIKRGQKTYLAEVENNRVNGKVVQKYIRYIGKEVDKKTVISISSNNLQVNQVKIYGSLLILHSISAKIRLPEVLGRYSNEILSMVYAHCLDYKSVNDMPGWFSRTDLNTILKLEDLTESRLLSSLDTLNEHSINDLQCRIFSRVRDVYNLSSRGIVYDVTNTYLYGTKCQMAKLGNSKEGKRDKPLIQIGLATTQKEGIPVFHKVFDGNIHDSKTFFALIQSFSEYNLNSGIFVYDRGISSSKNIREISNLGWDTVCGIPIKSREKAIIREISNRRRDLIVNISNRVTINKNIFYIKSIPYQIGDIRGKLVICYNEKLKTDIRESRYDEITNAKALLFQGKSIKKGLEKYFTQSGRVRRSELERAEEFDGYSCIFSTKNIPDQEVVSLYFDKDIIERAFKTLKGITHLRPIRHWLYNRVLAHVFICYLSYLLLSILKLRLKKLNISAHQALKDLSSMYQVYISDKQKEHKIVRTVTLSKHQEKILKAVDKSLIKKCSDHF